MLFFDLFNMEFKQTDNNANLFEFLNEANKMDIKQKLSDAKVLIVGVGGLALRQPTEWQWLMSTHWGYWI